jgi:hypothetical protein
MHDFPTDDEDTNTEGVSPYKANHSPGSTGYGLQACLGTEAESETVVGIGIVIR